MALTLVEAAKLETGDVFRQGAIELYAGTFGGFELMPFMNIGGNAYKYNREGSLAGVGFRGVNESYTASTGILNPLTESLVIAGGDLDVDKFIVDTQGESARTTHEAMKIRALGLSWTKTFIKGDNQTDPREFDGLQVRITGNQKIQAGTTANGTPLSLTKLDQAIDQTLDANALIMSKAMKRRLTQGSRATGVGGYITSDRDSFGRPISVYNDLPIITVDLDHEQNAILPFTEAATSGTSTATSIYVVSFGDGGVIGLQNGGIDVRDLGELDTQPLFRTRVEWYSTLAVLNGKAATRLWSISDAAVTA